MKKVKPFILSWFREGGGRERGQIRREYNEQLYSYGVSSHFNHAARNIGFKRSNQLV